MTIYRASQLLDSQFQSELGLLVSDRGTSREFQNIQLKHTSAEGTSRMNIWRNDRSDQILEISFSMAGMDDSYPYSYRVTEDRNYADSVADNFVHLVRGVRDYSQMDSVEFLDELGERLRDRYLRTGAETDRMVNWYLSTQMVGKSDAQKNNFLKQFTVTKMFYISYFDKKWYHKGYMESVYIKVNDTRTEKRVARWQTEEMYFINHEACYYLPNDPRIVNYNGGFYTRAQIENDFSLCSECNTLHRNEELVDGVCSSCIGLPAERLTLMNYSSRATEYFEFKVGKKANKKRPIFMGVELELEGATTGSIRKSAILLKDHAILKRDGSLSRGLEVCSAPATLDVHEEEFKKFFDNIPQELSAQASCGMHVHIDRKHLSKLQIGKMLDLVYKKENRRFVEAVAGRAGNHYCSLEEDRTFTFTMYKSEKSSSRYSGINLINEKTIELRIFNATTSYKEFMKNIEFCQALVDYTNPCGLNVANLKDQSKLEVFLQFIRNNWKEYHHLATFLCEKGYIEDRRTKPRSGNVKVMADVLKQAAAKTHAQAI